MRLRWIATRAPVKAVSLPERPKVSSRARRRTHTAGQVLTVDVAG